MPRQPSFEQIFTFRDLGGLPAAHGRLIRHGRVFRSAGLQWATDGDVTRLLELWLKTVIDLRTTSEVDFLGRPPQLDGQVRTVQIPISEEAGLIEREGASFAPMIKKLALADAYPVIIHCGAGVNRTGIAVALTLSLVGVGDPEIANDYAASREPYLRGITIAMEKGLYPAELDPSDPDIRREQILEVLGTVRRRYGSVHDYLVSGGASERSLSRLAGLLLESRPG